MGYGLGVGLGVGVSNEPLSRAWLAGSQLAPRQAKRPCSGVRSHMKQARRGCCAALSSTLGAVRRKKQCLRLMTDYDHVLLTCSPLTAHC